MQKWINQFDNQWRWQWLAMAMWGAGNRIWQRTTLRPPFDLHAVRNAEIRNCFLRELLWCCTYRMKSLQEWRILVLYASNRKQLFVAVNAKSSWVNALEHLLDIFNLQNKTKKDVRKNSNSLNLAVATLISWKLECTGLVVVLMVIVGVTNYLFFKYNIKQDQVNNADSAIIFFD